MEFIGVVTAHVPPAAVYSCVLCPHCRWSTRKALAVVVRFIDGFVIKQCLVHFLTLAMSMTGEEIARELISALSVEYGITSRRLLAAMRD